MAEPGEADARPLAGRYRVRGTLGRGGMGEVQEVEDLLREGRVMALKRFRIDAGADTAELFRREFLTLAKLQHPNLAEVYDFGVIPETGEAYFTAERILGRDLLDATGGMGWEEIVEVFVQLCRGLAFIHSRGLVHRDVKPSNVLVTLEGGAPRVKLIDFGLAVERRGGGRSGRRASGPAPATEGRAGGAPAERARGPRGDGGDAGVTSQVLPLPVYAAAAPLPPPDPALAATGTIPALSTPPAIDRTEVLAAADAVADPLETSDTAREAAIRGTVHYIAPEVASGLPASRRSDLYSLGATLYHVATRRLPFEGGGVREVLRRHLEERPPPPRDVRPDVPEALERVILRLLEKDPERRPASADEVIAALSALSGREIPVETRETEESWLRSGRFVGREIEMRTLADAFAATFDGAGRRGPSLVLVSGETGVGKTRLLKEFRHHAQLAHAEVIEAQCEAQGRAYAGIADAARGLLRLVRRAEEALLGPEAVLVRRFLGEEADPGGAAPQGSRRASPRVPQDAARERLRLFDAVVTFLLAASWMRPVVFVLHDLERADAGTAALLAHVARAAGLAARDAIESGRPRPRILFVASATEDLLGEGGAAAVDAALLPLEDEELLLRVRLGPLDADAVQRLLGTMLGAEGDEERSPAFAALARRVQAETHGNPFLVEETMKALLEAGAVRREAGGFRITGAVEGAPIAASPRATPLRALELFTARLERTPAAVRRLLEVLAVARRPATAALLEEIATGAEPAHRGIAAAGRLAVLVHQGLVVAEEEPGEGPSLRGEPLSAEGGVPPGSAWRGGKARALPDEDGRPPRYRLAHELFRRAIHAGLSPARRTALHLSAGLALERALAAAPGSASADPVPLAALVDHMTEGGRRDRAFRYAREAGDEAARLFASETAVALYERALAVAREDALDPAEGSAGLPAAEMVHVLESLGRVLERLGDHAGAAGRFREALLRAAAAGPSVGPEGLARLHRRLGEALAARGEHDQALESFGAGMRLLGAGDRIASSEGAQLLGATAATYVKLGLYDMAIGFCRSGKGWLGEGGATSPDGAALDNTIGVALSCLGRYEEAAAAFEAALQVREQAGETEAVAQTLGNLGAIFVETGQVGRAIAFFEQALEKSERAGDARAIAGAAANLGAAYAALGQEERAAQSHARSLAIFERAGDPEGVVLALTRIGVIEAASGDLSASSARLERARRVLRRVGPGRASVAAALLEGRLCSIAGARAEAREALERGLGLADALGLAREVAEASFLLGEEERAAGRLDEAERALNRALTDYERLGNALEAASVTIEIQELLVDRGDLDLARLVAEKLDATARDVRAGRLLGRLELAQGRLILALEAREPSPEPQGRARLGDAVRRLERARELAIAERRPELRWRADHEIGRASAQAGALDRALAAAVRAMETLRDLYAQVPEPLRASYLADPARQRVRLDLAAWRARVEGEAG